MTKKAKAKVLRRESVGGVNRLKPVYKPLASEPEVTKAPLSGVSRNFP